MEEEEQQWKEEAICDGLDSLENAFDRYKVAHKEVMNQLMLEVEETLGDEDEATFEQVLGEDADTNNIRPFIHDALSTIGKLKAHLRREKAAEKKPKLKVESKMKQTAAVAEVKGPDINHLDP